MARDETPTFDRGKTYFDGRTITAADVAATKHLEGQEKVFEDIDYSAGPFTRTLRSGRKVRCRCVRNNSGIALLPKRLVTMEATAGDWGKRVDGYADVNAERAYPVDEFLVSTGVPVDDLFWIVVEGPAMCSTALEANGDNVIAVGDRLTSQTAATSGATTAGRVKKQAALSAATSGVVDFTTIFAEGTQYVGSALSAKTTANTAADILVDIGRF